MKKNPEVTAITRKNFIEAYCQLSQKIPLEKITVRAVTECAGYNRSTFYQYFDDINDVVTAIESEVLAHVLVKVDDNLLRGQLTLGFIEAFSHLHAELSNYYQVVFLPTVNSSFTNKLKTAVMEKVIEAYHLPATDVKVQYIIEFNLSGVISVIYRWLGDSKKISTNELAALIRDVINTGLEHQLSIK